MSYAPYPAYKDSGVSWLGSIPEHWDWAKLYLLSKRYAGGTPDKNVPEYWEDGTIPWLNSGSVNQFNIDTPSAFITEDAYKNSSAKWVPEGALLMALAGQGKTKGMVAQTTFDTTCNQSMAAIVWKKVNPRFMLWWLNSQYLNIRGLASSDARDGLNLEMLARIPCPLPSKEEQTAIADFLDKKTAEIDDLIAKKEELLRLLAEQRTALITHAVTKGLNPNAPMKPSGVDWLGDVPEGWQRVALKRYLETPITDGPHETPNFPETGVPFISAEAVRDSKIDFSRKRGFISKEDDARFARKYKPRRGDIYVVKSGATTGRVAMVETDEDFNIWSPLAAIRVDPRYLYGRYLFHFLGSKCFTTEIELGWSFGTQQNIGMGVIGNLNILLPPLSEQREIARFLDEKKNEIDSASEMVTLAITRLKEYRTAIITNAVTGKIKVA